MPPSARRSEEHDTSNDKLNELKNEISEIYDFYGYDATLYYVLSTTDRCVKSEADNLVYVHQQKPTVSKIQAAYSKEEREIVFAGHNLSELKWLFEIGL